MAVTLTDKAAERIRHFLDSRGSGLGLRLGVKTTGCSGMAYVLEFIDEANPEDTSFEAIGKGAVLDLLKLMTDLGYDGVELGIRNPEAVDTQSLSRVMEQSGLRLIAIGTGQAFVDEGLAMTHAESAFREMALQRLKRQVDLAQIFDAYVILGLIRGNLGNQRSRRFEYFTTALLRLCDYAQTKGVTLLVEPLNRYESDFLNKGAEVLELINTLSCENLKLLLDSFHMNIEEKDPAQTIVSAGSLLGHVHLADSNRQYPGQGHIDFLALISTLRQIGYSSYLSGEMLNYPDPETCILEYLNYLREIINE